CCSWLRSRGLGDGLFGARDSPRSAVVQQQLQRLQKLRRGGDQAGVGFTLFARAGLVDIPLAVHKCDPQTVFAVDAAQPDAIFAKLPRPRRSLEPAHENTPITAA